MSQSQTPYSKFLASLLTSKGFGANPCYSDFATQDPTCKKRHTYLLNIRRYFSVPDGLDNLSFSSISVDFMVDQR